MTHTIASRPVNTSTATRTAAPRRWANVTLWVLQVVAAAVYVTAAIPKLTATQQAVDGFNAIGLGVAGMYIIGALELAGAVAVLIPRLAGLAGVCFVALMIGAVTTTVLTDPGMVAFPAVVLVLVAVIAWGRRRSTAELVALVRRTA